MTRRHQTIITQKTNQIFYDTEKNRERSCKTFLSRNLHVGVISWTIWHLKKFARNLIFVINASEAKQH
jgi:hypothetical protein